LLSCAAFRADVLVKEAVQKLHHQPDNLLSSSVYLLLPLLLLLLLLCFDP
jgi:hypothetical protein